MRSQDGGKKWDRVSTVSGELVDAAAFSGNDAWALGQLRGESAVQTLGRIAENPFE